ncbi:hypothetical protein R6Q59_013502 [Mikania micrantha]
MHTRFSGRKSPLEFDPDIEKTARINRALQRLDRIVTLGEHGSWHDDLHEEEANNNYSPHGDYHDENWQPQGPPNHQNYNNHRQGHLEPDCMMNMGRNKEVNQVQGSFQNDKRQNAMNSKTYHPGLRNHPNFRYGNSSKQLNPNFQGSNQQGGSQGSSYRNRQHNYNQDDGSHFLIHILVKHLDNKQVTKQPILQMQIVNVATQLSGYVKQHTSITIVGAISDLIKHLRKCLQRPCEFSSPRDGSDSLYIDLQSSLENCISNLSCKVGDVGPILDTMAIVLENIPTSAAMARANIYALYRTAQVISPVPNKTYFRKVFPDALFHHLLLAMSHLDHETRVLSHRVFSIVLVPSLSQSWSIQDLIPSQAGFPTIVSQKIADGSNKSILETIDEETMEKENDIENHMKHATKSFSCSSSNATSTCNGNTASSSMRLSGHQVSLVLSSIWIQATSMENKPENFEAMGHTFTLALSFILSKVDPHLVLDEDNNRMQVICKKPGDESCYGSHVDEASVMKSFFAIELKDQQLKDTLSTHLASCLGKSSEEEVSNMKAQLSQRFLPDEEYLMGVSLFKGTQKSFSHMDIQAFDEVIFPIYHHTYINDNKLIIVKCCQFSWNKRSRSFKFPMFIECTCNDFVFLG